VSLLKKLSFSEARLEYENKSWDRQEKVSAAHSNKKSHFALDILSAGVVFLVLIASEQGWFLTLKFTARYFIFI
jgi:hypothetical protein